MLKQEPGIFYLRFPGQLLMRQRQFEIKNCAVGLYLIYKARTNNGKDLPVYFK